MVVKNFLFHRVSDETDRLWPPMPVALFQSLIAYITRRYDVVMLEEFLAGNHKGDSKKTKATILFDDGYKDNIEFAVPVLDKFKCPASFYVVTGCIDNNRPTWTYIVDNWFQQTQKSKLSLDMDFVPAHFRQNDIADKSARLQLGGRLKPWMKTLSNDQRRQVMTRLETSFSDVGVPGDKMMSWNDLRQMKAAGYTIGSHSVTHPLLATVTDDRELFAEINDSGKRIEQELGAFPYTISYPVGSFDQRVIDFSQKAGYKAGLAVEQKFYKPASANHFAIPRVELYNEPMWKCHLRMSGLYSWLKG